MWYSLLQEAITSNPDLIITLSLHYQEINRLYDDVDLFSNALSSQQNQQIFKASFNTKQLREQKEFKIYQSELKPRNSFTRGALTIYGLAFDIKVFCR